MFEGRLRAAGIVAKSTTSGQIADDDDDRTDLTDIHRRLAADDSSAISTWLSADVAGPLTIADLSTAAWCAGLALRLAVDGREATRPIALRSIEVADRIERVDELFQAERVEMSRMSMYRFAKSAMVVNQCLLSYLQLHGMPDADAPNDPDAYVGPDDRSKTADVLLRRIDRSFRVIHQTVIPGRVDKLTAEEDESLEDLYLGCLADRVTAELQHYAIVGKQIPRQERAAIPAQMSVVDLERSMRALRRGANTSTRAGKIDRASRLSSAALAAEALINGPSESLASAWTDLATSEGADALDTVNRYLTAIRSTPIELADAVLDRIQQCLTFIRVQDRETADRLRAHAGPIIRASLGGIASTHPTGTNAIAWQLAGYEAPSDNWPHDRTHVWVLDGTPPIALLHNHEGVAPVALPDVDVEFIGTEVLWKHAEEFEDHHPTDGLRKELSRQFKPLSSALAGLSGRVTIHAFGILKYVPFAALTGTGSILAAIPQLTVLPPHLPRQTRPDLKRRRLLVRDQQLRIPPSILASSDHCVEIDSGAGDDGDDDIRAREILREMESCTQFIFFGHGYVDQFSTSRTGLVLRNFSDGSQRRIATTQFASLDLANVEWAIVMACGAGQGGMFAEADLSVAAALTLAGVREVVAPIWPISVDVGAAFLRSCMEVVDGRGLDLRTAWSTGMQQDPNRFAPIALYAL